MTKEKLDELNRRIVEAETKLSDHLMIINNLELQGLNSARARDELATMVRELRDLGEERLTHIEKLKEGKAGHGQS
jgi:hypothetical protein